MLETRKPAVSNRINITRAQQANHSLCCVTIISDRIQQVRNIQALLFVSLLPALVQSPMLLYCLKCLLLNLTYTYDYVVFASVLWVQNKVRDFMRLANGSGTFFHRFVKSRVFIPSILEFHVTLICMHTNFTVKMCMHMYSNIGA